MRMEASKCPKCGEMPTFVDHVEKWYCFGCNTYVEEEDHECQHEVEAEAPVVPEVPVKAEEPVEETAEELAVELTAMEKADEGPRCPACGALMETKDGKLVCMICGPEVVEEKAEPVPENDSQKLIEAVIKAPEPETPVVKQEPVPVAPAAVPEPAPTPAPEPVKEAPKAAPAAPKEDKGVRMCPSCGQPLKFIEKYSRYYCYSCKKYAPMDAPKAPEPAKAPSAEQKKCPDCGGELRFIEKYGEHYCNACKKYPYHKKKDSEDKPPEVAPTKPTIQVCAKCGKPLKFVEKYDRWYCYECRSYAPKTVPSAPAPPKAEKKVCPVCGDEMKFVSQYNEWYCYKCKKYTLRPSKPVLLV